MISTVNIQGTDHPIGASYDNEGNVIVDTYALQDNVNQQINDLKTQIKQTVTEVENVNATITNLADDEDITSVDDGTGSNVLKFADRTYNANNFSGKGYKILRKNIQSVNIVSTKINITEVPSTDGTLSFTINGKETQVVVSATTDNTTALVSQKVATALQESMTEYDVSIDASLITLTRKSSGLVTPSVFSASTTGVVCTITDSIKREFRNILMSNMINQPNTIYEIRYDFDLDGGTVNIPENCTLKFEGGSLNNGILSNSLYISCDKNSICFLDKLRFNNAIFKNREIYANWFGDLSYENDSAIVIQRCINACNNTNDIILPTHSMSIYSSIIIDKNIRIKGVYEAKRDIYYTYFDVKTSNISVFVISSKCEIDNINISSNTQLERQWIGFTLKQGTGITLRNTSVVRADIAYYLGETPDNGYLNATELNCVSATYCDKGIWLEHSEFPSVWKNATKIIPSQISFCDICIQIDMGNSTDIYGGACEIGAADTLPYQKNKIGILVQNRAVVNLFGGLWLENFDIPILTKDTAIVNVCGDLVQLSNGISKDNSVIKYNTLQSRRCIFDDEVSGNLLSVDDNLVFDLNADDMKLFSNYYLKAEENKYLATSRDDSLNGQLMFLKRLDGINYFDSAYGYSKPINEIKSEQCTIIIDGLYLYKNDNMSFIFFDNIGLALGGYSKTDKNLCVSACAIFGFDKSEFYNIGYRGINREEDDIKDTYKHITLAITFDFKKKIATLIKLDDFVANDNVTLKNWEDGYIPTLNKLTSFNTSTFLFRRIIMFKQCMNTYQLKYIKNKYLNKKVNRYDEIMALSDKPRNIRISDNYNNVYNVISKFNFDTNRLEVSGLIKVSNYYVPGLLLGSFANLTNKYKVDLSRLCVIQNKYQNKNILITYNDDNNEIIYKLEQNLNKKGTTEDRPERPSIGFIYKDTTLNKLIIWEGTKWVNLDGTELAQ